MSKEPKRFKQTEIGELPEEWEVVRLGEVCKTASGGTPNRKEHKFFGGGIPWVKSSELKDTVILETEETLSEEGLKHSSAKIFPKGTVVVAMYGATVGRTGILGIDAATNQACCAFFPDPNLLDKMFLFFWLQYVRPVLARQSVGAAQPNISQQILRQLPIPLPPLEEQKRIAGVLRLVDRVAEETKRIINIYERAKKFALKHLLTRGIGHTRFKQTEIGELPEEWEVVRAEEDFEIIIGKTPSRNQSKYWDKSNETDNFWATIEDLKERFITTTKERVSDEGIKVARMRRVPEGTVLVSFKLTIGRVAIAGRPIYFNEAIAAFLPKSDCRFNRDFLFYALHLLPLWAEQQNLIDQAVKGVTLNKKKLQRLLLPLPPLEEQKRIAEMLSTIDAAIENERRYLGVLEKCKKWMLDNLLTGKVRLSSEVDEILKGVLPDAL